MTRLLFFTFTFCLFSRLGLAQEGLKPIASFSKDSIKIGESVNLSLSLYYPSTTQILFPDTNYNFSPFELIRKDFFTTRTKGEISKDCVVYQLATYALDSIQSLKIPVYQFKGEDSTGWFSNEISIRIVQKIKTALPSNPVFETELSLIPVAKRINYPYILIGMSIVLILILLVNFFFDRPIQKFFFLFLEKRRHNAWLNQYDKQYNQLEGSLNVENVEGLLVTWRKYIERVDGEPYTSFTSTEIFKILPDKILKEVLQEVDRWIYGGIDMIDWRFNMDYVKQISIQLYLKKRESIRNGKFE